MAPLTLPYGKQLHLDNLLPTAHMVGTADASGGGSAHHIALAFGLAHLENMDALQADFGFNFGEQFCTKRYSVAHWTTALTSFLGSTQAQTKQTQGGGGNNGCEGSVNTLTNTFNPVTPTQVAPSLLGDPPLMDTGKATVKATAITLAFETLPPATELAMVAAPKVANGYPEPEALPIEDASPNNREMLP